MRGGLKLTRQETSWYIYKKHCTHCHYNKIVYLYRKLKFDIKMFITKFQCFWLCEGSSPGRVGSSSEPTPFLDLHQVQKHTNKNITTWRKQMNETFFTRIHLWFFFVFQFCVFSLRMCKCLCFSLIAIWPSAAWVLWCQTVAKTVLHFIFINTKIKNVAQHVLLFVA